MRTAAGLLALGLVAAGASAQQARFPFDTSLPPVGPTPSLAPGVTAAPGAVAPRIDRRGSRHRGFAGPAWFGGYAAYDYPRAPNVVVIQPPAAPPPQEPAPVRREAPEPVRSEIREYDWEERPIREADPASFAVALKDGTVHAARLVWFQNETLYLVTAEGARRSVPVGEFDRPRTEQLNRDRGLRFFPPPG